MNKYLVRVSVTEPPITVSVIATSNLDAMQMALLMVGLPDSEEELNCRCMFGEDISQEVLSLAKLNCVVVGYKD